MSVSGEAVVRTERRGPVALIVVDSPPVNALGSAVIRGLEAALAAAIGDPGCRSAVLTAAGERFFSAGADLRELAVDAESLRLAGLRLMGAMEGAPLPVLAAVNGAALGGGCELALAADLRLASSAATFGQPEVRLGIMPGWGGTQRLGRLIGRAAAAEMLLDGQPVGAQRALELGLVSRVVAPEQLLEAAVELGAGLAGGAPLAQAAIKRALHQGLDRPLGEGLAMEQSELEGLRASDDAAEGVSAFLQKRPPLWSGR